jgi:hypothetical protein
MKVIACCEFDTKVIVLSAVNTKFWILSEKLKKMCLLKLSLN